MKASRLVVLLAAAVAVVASPGAAQAATITQTYHADSGDACRYGVSDGTLGWRFGSTSPVPVTGVEVKGLLTDRPAPTDPTSVCADDRYYSTVTFVAYAGNAAVDRETRNADNSTVAFEFVLGSNTTTTRVDRVTVQVCRSPLVTLPPSYCGRLITYLAPPLG